MIPSPPALPDPISALDRRGLLRGIMAADTLPWLAGPAWATPGAAAAAGARTRTLHGITIADPFGWLDDAALDDPKVIQLMTDFQTAAHQAMAPLGALTRQLRGEADGARPRQGTLRGAVLYGYGAYGVPSNPDFDPQRPSLLDRGVAYGIAHVRGGGDLGGAWHDAGRGPARGKPVEDFIACGTALVAQGIVPQGKIVSMGRSAGGWLVGAALNRAPDLWAGVMADVPYVDVLSTLLDPNRPLSAAETSEVGDILNDPAAFARIMRLCAYQNVPERRLPPVYLTASLADVRIPWSGILKYVARLRAAHPENAVVLRLDRDGNHWGPANPETADTWRAERVAFTLMALDLV